MEDENDAYYGIHKEIENEDFSKKLPALREVFSDSLWFNISRVRDIPLRKFLRL